MTLIIPVNGMTCQGCVKSLERALGQQAGVNKATASLEKKNVSVDFDDQQIARPDLVRAIERAGFSVAAD